MGLSITHACSELWFSFSFRTNFERGIDNYPFGVEGCIDERKSYLIDATFVTVSRKLRVLASQSLVASLRSSMTG